MRGSTLAAVAVASWVGLSPAALLAAEPSDGTAAETPTEAPKAKTEATVTVKARRALKDLAAAGELTDDLAGIADSATEGTVTAKELQARALARAGDILEAVPGVVVSQHSGEGKANQYTLRGFDLDHGTDLASFVAGVPVNLPTHAHGQGYADLNFVIPELVSSLQYRKGPYDASEGDFAAAGSARLDYVRSLPEGFVLADLGSFGRRRGVAARSFSVGGGDLLGAVELNGHDGPWDRPDEYRRANGVLSFRRGDGENGYALTALSYDGRWNATDQVPRRAVESGALGRFAAVDPSDGGTTFRRSLSFELRRSDETTSLKATAYLLHYGLDLFSNFTYFLNDPVNGDQFEQVDRRVVTGLRVSRQWATTLFGKDAELVAGLDARNDNIATAGLFRTNERVRIGTVRDDHVVQSSGGLHLQATVVLTPWLRTVAGLRGDAYRFRVSSDLPANSGNESAALLSPKLTVVLGPWSSTELYLNAGWGFHSNDGRGATLRVDPATGERAEPVRPLVRARGAEAGVRSSLAPGLSGTIAAWGLEMESELVFAGDLGTTEASRRSRRLGVEVTLAYRPLEGLVFDAEAALTRARFVGGGGAGDRIPGSVGAVFSAGVHWEGAGGLSGSLRARTRGPRELAEDGSVRSASATFVSAQAGWQIDSRVALQVEALNLLGARTSDVEYLYTSRLPGEAPGGVSDVHLHPAEPRSLRVSLKVGL